MRRRPFGRTWRTGGESSPVATARDGVVAATGLVVVGAVAGAHALINRATPAESGSSPAQRSTRDVALLMSSRSSSMLVRPSSRAGTSRRLSGPLEHLPRAQDRHL